jgi:3-oxoadipate enol-lactonase
MARIEVNGAQLYVEDRGIGPEAIVFSHGLLFSGRIFDDQVNAFADRYRCVRWDHRGQGLSEVTESGYDMDSLAEDAAALIRQLGCAPCHFVGLSMGGFVGLRLAIRHASLLRSLVLLDTSADPEEEKARAQYRKLNFVARWLGLGLVAGRVMPILFGPRFLADDARAGERALWRKRLTENHRIGISVPTLIVVGEHDAATPLARTERMRERIPGARLVVIPGAGHMSTIEEPVAVNRAIETFLGGLR